MERSGDKVCPLSDTEGYEFVQLRKPGPDTNDSAPEMQPFAPLPGYVPMGPPPDEGYEILSAPVETQQQSSNYGGTYETLTMAVPQRTGSQIGTASRNSPVSAPLYEVPPTASPPVYEIAPPPRSTAPVSELAMCLCYRCKRIQCRRHLKAQRCLRTCINGRPMVIF